MKQMMEHIHNDGKNMNGHISNMKHMVYNRVNAYHKSGTHKAEMKELAEHTLSEKEPK